MKQLLTNIFILFSITVIAQPWSPDGICDFTNGQQWNNGNSKGCACTWYDTDGNLNCAFGDCGQNSILECVYDCNGENGYATDQQPRICDINSVPICWFQGSGSAGQLFCEQVLPASFLYLRGHNNGSKNIIEWASLSEYNTSHYTIFKSIDGVTFESIISLIANGNTSEISTYRAIDLDIEDMTYYNVRQYDIDGTEWDFGYVVIDKSLDEVHKVINMIGQEVGINTPGIKILIYKTGKTIRIY